MPFNSSHLIDDNLRSGGTFHLIVSKCDKVNKSDEVSISSAVLYLCQSQVKGEPLEHSQKTIFKKLD